MLPAPLAIALALALVVALFFVTRAGRPPAAVRKEEGGRRPVFSVELIGLLVLLALLLAALWVSR
jgi:hypothetical protein